jgi:UrcA family protein
MSKFVNVVTASIIALALGATSIAAAETDAGLKGTAKKVSYSDLNLDKEEGAIVLYKRLQIAARQVCNVRTFTVKGSLKEAAEKTACYRDTLDVAVSQLDNQYVNKLHAG